MKTFGQHTTQEPQVSKSDKLTETSPTLEFKTDYTVRHNSALTEDPNLTWQSLLPVEVNAATLPSLVTERNLCGLRAEPIASAATCTLPLVLFLKPTGQDKPEANSL